ncbi:small cell adhesion glycoprotein [Mixophyes fleayi]|uniref:small cell adhesion glycoprotein n=1 Tax=Mixophyes fleayi TaxID=3061075 RepID=UPI003F4DFB40
MDNVSTPDPIPPVVKATTSSSDIEGFDKAVIAGVIAAVFITFLIVLVLIAVYLYKHKGSYRTHETVDNEEEDEAKRTLQMKSESNEDKQEYFM